MQREYIPTDADRALVGAKRPRSLALPTEAARGGCGPDRAVVARATEGREAHVVVLHPAVLDRRDHPDEEAAAHKHRRRIISEEERHAILVMETRGALRVEQDEPKVVASGKHCP